jgi:uncharacterized membrane protein
MDQIDKTFKSMPKIKVPKKGNPLPLNQPFPEEIDSAYTEVAEKVGEKAIIKAAQDSKRKKDKIKQKAGEIVASVAVEEPNKQSSSSKGNEDSTKDKPQQNKTVGDILESPAEAIKTKNKDDKSDTRSPIVKTIVLVGVIVVALGLIAFFTISGALGLILMVLGALAVIFCVFLPITHSKASKQASSN